MNIVLQRRPSVGGATIGELTVDGVRICFSLEDEIREVEGQPVSEWKVKGATAIPAGRYRITLEHSPRFGPDTIKLTAPEADRCRAEGGCVVITVEMLRTLVQAAQDCRRRNSI